MPVTATIRSTGDSLRQEVLVDGRHTVVIDEPESLGGTDTAPTPYEMLATALAGCVMITLRMYGRRKNWDIGEIGVDACFDNDERPTSVAVTVHLPEGLDDEQAARLRAVAKACPISKMLATGMAIEHREAVA
jgi:putative redox protein